MTRDGRYRAVLDRFEDGLAILLVEEDEEVVEETAVDRDDLPAGVEEGAVLSATYDGGTVRRIVFEPEETARRRAAARDRFDDLAERPPGRGGENGAGEGGDRLADGEHEGADGEDGAGDGEE